MTDPEAGESGSRPWLAATCASAGCSATFMGVYSACNALAAANPGVSERWWTWELSIPLVPALIVPYMSIDLLFALSPFLCTSRAEVRTLASRFLSATLLAGLCFMLWPLRLGFPREPVDGLFAPVFTFLRGFDQPYNLFPSLHITLAFILRWTYHRHLRGAARTAFHGWFLLISLSTLLIHQHQVLDIVGGLVLALVVFYLFPGPVPGHFQSARNAPYRPSAREWTLCAVYSAVSAATGIVSAALGSYAAWLLWPAMSLAILALGYGSTGPAIFQKQSGRPSFAARVVLGPWFTGLWLSRLWFWRGSDPANEVRPGLWLGSVPRARQAVELARANFAAIDLTAEHAAPRALRTSGAYENVPMLDLVPPSVDALSEVAGMIRRALDRGPVIVWCGLGYGRSAAAVAAFLLRDGQAATVDQAYALIRAARPRVVLREDVRHGLERMMTEVGKGALPSAARNPSRAAVEAPSV